MGTEIKKFIPFNKLSNVDSDSDILRQSFNYLVLKVCEEYSKSKDIDFKDFNAENDITNMKLYMLPFYVSTSNGHSKSLFNLFGNFKAIDMGPISVTIFSLLFIAKFQSDYFIFDDLTLKVKERWKSFEEIEEDILNQKIDGGINFKEIEIENDNFNNANLYKAIDSGINTLSKQSNNIFFTFSEDGLRRNAFKYSAFNNKLNTTNSVIDYTDIRTDKEKLPYYAENY